MNESVMKNYRMLEVGEVIQEGDEYFNTSKSEWLKSDMAGFEIMSGDDIYRRPYSVHNPDNVPEDKLPNGYRFLTVEENAVTRPPSRGIMVWNRDYFEGFPTGLNGMSDSTYAVNWPLPGSKTHEEASNEVQQDTPREETQKRKILCIGGEAAGEQVEDEGKQVHYTKQYLPYANQTYIRRHIEGQTVFVVSTMNEFEAGAELCRIYQEHKEYVGASEELERFRQWSLVNKTAPQTPEPPKEEVDPKLQKKRLLGQFLRTCALVRMPDPSHDGPSQAATFIFQYGKFQGVCEISPEGTVDFYDGTTTEIATPTLILPLP